MAEFADASLDMLFSGVVSGSAPRLPSNAGELKSLRSELHKYYMNKIKGLHIAAGDQPSKGKLLGEVNVAVASKLRKMGSQRG